MSSILVWWRTRILMAALPPEMIDNLVDNEKFFEDYHWKRNNSSAFDVKTAIYYNTLVASPILGLGLAVFGYRERAVILLTALFLGLQNSKVDPYRKTCKMQLYRHTYLLSKTSRFLDNPFIEALRSTPQYTAQGSKPTSKKLFSQPRLEYLNSRK